MGALGVLALMVLFFVALETFVTAALGFNVVVLLVVLLSVVMLVEEEEEEEEEEDKEEDDCLFSVAAADVATKVFATRRGTGALVVSNGDDDEVKVLFWFDFPSERAECSSALTTVGGAAAADAI